VLKRPVTFRPKDAKTGDPMRGPVAWWKLDETQGPQAADASGHNLNARVQGAPRWSPGQGHLGGALELDGAQTHVDCGDAADFDFRDSLTVSLWFKSRGFKKAPQTLIGKGGDTWGLQSDGEKGQIVFGLGGPQPTGKDRNKAPQAKSKRGLGDGQWHHVVGVYDGKRIALFVDGQLEATINATGPVAMNTEPLLLGERFDGWLDDARLFDRGLSDKEIDSLYHNGTITQASAK
jgi:large repetitive protein